MGFSEDTVHLAWAWAGRQCQCKRDGHGHPDRCDRDIVWRRRGAVGSGGWDVLPRFPFDSGGTDDPENCEILCWACHQQARSRPGRQRDPLRSESARCEVRPPDATA